MEEERSEAKKPIRTFSFRLMPDQTRLDVSVWPGREKNGKILPCRLSLRLTPRDGPELTAHLSRSDVFDVSALLQHYGLEMVQFDSQRRLAAWKERRQERLVPAPA